MSSRRCTLVGCSLRRAGTTMSDYGTSAHTCNDLILSLLWTQCSKINSLQKPRKRKEGNGDDEEFPKEVEVDHDQHGVDVENTTGWNAEIVTGDKQKPIVSWLHWNLLVRKNALTEKWSLRLQKSEKVQYDEMHSDNWMVYWKNIKWL